LIDQHAALVCAGFIILGFGTGVYGTLIGAGGGFILMPVLLLLFPDRPPEELTAISLAVVFFNALSGSGQYAIMKRIDYKTGLIFAASTIPGAVIGALNTAAVARPLFNVIFGVLLLAVAVFLLLQPTIKEDGNPHPTYLGRFTMNRHLVEAGGIRFDYSFNTITGIIMSFFIGYVSSFLGIGGGIIHVPVMVYLLNFPVHIATATSQFILAIMALTGTLVHLWSGAWTHGVSETISLSIGVLLGAPMGAHFSGRVKGHWIIRGLAAALGLAGMRILFQFFAG
jgi:uncharacterized protein